MELQNCFIHKAKDLGYISQKDPIGFVALESVTRYSNKTVNILNLNKTNLFKFRSAIVITGFLYQLYLYPEQ